MGNRALKYGAVLIGMYLGVAYASGAGKLLTGGRDLVVGTTKALQGR